METRLRQTLVGYLLTLGALAVLAGCAQGGLASEGKDAFYVCRDTQPMFGCTVVKNTKDFKERCQLRYTGGGTQWRCKSPKK